MQTNIVHVIDTVLLTPELAAALEAADEASDAMGDMGRLILLRGRTRTSCDADVHACYEHMMHTVMLALMFALLYIL